MVFIPLESLSSGYTTLRRDAQRHVSSVLLAVATDTDALCAARILTQLLVADGVPHRMLPVSGYADLSYLANLVPKDTSLTTIVLINCGAMADLQQLFPSDNLTLYVVDAHRPYALENIFKHHNVFLWDDGGIDDLADVKTAYLAMEYEEDEESEASSESEPEENEEDDNNSDSENEGDEPRKRKRQESPDRTTKRSARKKRQENQRVIAQYYAEGTFHGTSCAALMYTLAEQLGRASNELLWLAIIGLTDQYIHDKISLLNYDQQLTLFRQEVLRFNLDDQNEPDELEDTYEERENVPHDDDRTIAFKEEFRLMLLRHWSLYEALYHSTYVATRMGLWKDKGRQKLTNMLANSALPIKECQNNYDALPIDIKSTVGPKLKKWGPKYNMPEIFYPSFTRCLGYRKTISAADAVYALSALMDSGAEWLSKHASFTAGEDGPQGDATSAVRNLGLGVGTRSGFAGHFLQIDRDLLFSTQDAPTTEKPTDQQEENDQEEDEQDNTQQRKETSKNFYVAFKALDDINLLIHGIHLSMHLQKALVKTGMMILERKLVKTFRTFRFALLPDTPHSHHHDVGGLIGDAAPFGRSVSHLERLGQFLLDAYRSFHKDMPLVLAVPADDDSESYLVIGIAGAQGLRQVKNTFGISFQEAVEVSGARVKSDRFESSVIQIKKQDLSMFMENLKYAY